MPPLPLPFHWISISWMKTWCCYRKLSSWGWCWKLCLEWNVASADGSPMQKIHENSLLSEGQQVQKKGMAQLKKNHRDNCESRRQWRSNCGVTISSGFLHFKRHLPGKLNDKPPANSKLKRRSHQGDEKVGDSGINIRTPSPCCRQQKQGNECWQFMSLLDYIVIYEPSISQGRSPAQIGWNARVTMEGAFIHWRCAGSTGWLASRGCSQRYFVS